MRVAIFNWSGRRIAGTEVYLENLLEALQSRGVTAAFASVVDTPADRAPIAIPPGVERLTDGAAGVERWRPDVIYAHGPIEDAVEGKLLSLAPAAYFIHNFYGTCISGFKRTAFPNPEPCRRVFGWQCLGHYLPRRCGGLNPATMVKRWMRQSRRLKSLRGYRLLLTHSEWMRDEYLRHGFASDAVRLLPFGLPARAKPATVLHSIERTGPVRLIGLGRMESIKGFHYLLRALPRIRQSLGRPVEVVLAGEGPDRSRLEDEASSIGDPSIRVHFPGWLSGEQVEAKLSESDLLVVPSLWPEPFGLVGLEAARLGVPAAAFAAGGIPMWLQEGVSGSLAPADPPTPDGLADAVVRCLADAGVHAKLRSGAVLQAERLTLERHVDALIPLLESIAGRS